MTKKKIGLVQLNKKEALETKSGYEVLNDEKTGYVCGCGCYYEGTPGGSTTFWNKTTNLGQGLYSPIQ